MLSVRFRWTPRVTRIAVGMSVCALLGACGGSDDSADTSSPTTSTTAASSGAGSSTTAAVSGGDVWRRDASEYRGRDGERFTIECTPDGVGDSIWGVETYTDDSSICTAAVHVGLITFEEGGEVDYEIAPGLDEYGSGIGQEVLSNRYGKYDGSFIFPEAPPGSGEFTVGAETWRRTASESPRQNGDRVTVECAPGGPAGSVWGTGTYTSDSSICTAAVHAGLITVADGGKVTIEIAPGADAYQGTTANGVTSSSYGSYGGSFKFPENRSSD